MSGSSINLLTPSGSDAEQRFSMTSGALDSLMEVTKVADDEHLSGFSGVLRRTLNEADEDGIDLSASGSGLPSGGNSLPDGQASEENALFLVNTVEAPTTVPASLSIQAGIEIKNADSAQAEVFLSQLPENEGGEQKNLRAPIVGMSSPPFEMPAGGTTVPTDSIDPAVSMSLSWTGENRRADVANQLHQQVANKLSAVNVRQPALDPDNGIVKTPVGSSMPMSGADHDRADSTIRNQMLFNRLDSGWGQSAAPFTGAAGEGKPAEKNTVSGSAVASAHQPLAVSGEQLRAGIATDRETFSGARAVADPAASPAERRVEAASGLASMPFGSFLRKGLSLSPADNRERTTQLVPGGNPAVSQTTVSTRQQTLLDTVQTLKAAVATASPDAGNTVSKLQEDGQSAPMPAQLGVNSGNASAVTTSTTTSAILPGTAHMRVDVPVGHAAWEQSMARQVLQAGHQQLQTLQIKLNPSNLGALEVRIAIDAETTSIVFSSHHAVVREAVEGAIPRLREMFSGSGLNLGDVNVANQGAAEDQGRHSSYQHADEPRAGTEIPKQHEALTDNAIDSNKGNSQEQLLDYYI